MKHCPECNGTGEIEVQIGGDGYDNRCCALADAPVVCPECNGTGKATQIVEEAGRDGA